MKVTIDQAGRLVVPKGLRDEIGLTPGPVDVHIEGSRIVIEPIVDDHFDERDGLMVVPATGEPLSDEAVRALIESGRR